MFPLLSKSFKLFLQHGVGNFYVGFWTSLVSTAIIAVQLDHFELFSEKWPMRPEHIAEVYSGTVSPDVCQQEVSKMERLHWCCPSGISSNHVLIVRIKLKREEAHNMQEPLDICKKSRISQKTDSTRCSEKQVSLHAVENMFRLMTYAMSGAKERTKITAFWTHWIYVFRMNSIWFHRLGELCRHYNSWILQRTECWELHYDTNCLELTWSNHKLQTATSAVKHAGFWSTVILTQDHVICAEH